MRNEVNKNLLDVSQIFQMYVTFAGDVDRTSVACDVDPQTVRDLAASERWGEKISDWQRLRDGSPQDVQVQINRAVNYVQAHRARALLDRVIGHLSAGSTDDLIERLTVNTKNGPEFRTRALTDLVKAMESCQLMTQRALGDTAGERPAPEEGTKGSKVALVVMEAMNAAESSALDSVALVRQQIAGKAKELRP